MGDLQQPGVLDSFAFTASAGQVLFFDEQSGDCLTPMRWKCIAPDGTVLFDEQFGGLRCGRDTGAKLLPVAGMYVITVHGVQSATGHYSFRIWEAPPAQQFGINIGDTVTANAPGPGAGYLEAPGAADRFTFTAAPGTKVYFDEQGGDCLAFQHWKCVDSQGQTIFDERFGQCSGDVGEQTLLLGGEYTIIVTGEEEGTGSYQFQIRLVQ